LNYYAIILGLFIIGGFGAVLWGWIIFAKARKTLRWPMVEGVIEQSAPTSEDNDLLPHIQFSYTVAAHIYQRTLEFPDGTNPSPELAASYAKKYLPVPKYRSITTQASLIRPPLSQPGQRRLDDTFLGVTAMALGSTPCFSATIDSRPDHSCCLHKVPGNIIARQCLSLLLA
jgi:hypothetical protein